MPQDHALGTNVFHFRKNSVEQAASSGAAEKLWSLQGRLVVNNRRLVMKIKAKNGRGKIFLSAAVAEDKGADYRYGDILKIQAKKHNGHLLTI